MTATTKAALAHHTVTRLISILPLRYFLLRTRFGIPKGHVLTEDCQQGLLTGGDKQPVSVSTRATYVPILELQKFVERALLEFSIDIPFRGTVGDCEEKLVRRVYSAWRPTCSLVTTYASVSLFTNATPSPFRTR